MTRALARLPMAVLYGLPGVGKSALAYACGAAWAGPLVYARADEGHLFSSLADELGGGRPDGASRVEALAAAVEDRGALLLLDDADRLPPPARDALLRALGERLRRGRAIVASGARLPAPGHYDRLELLVGGFDEASARRLWRGLDRLRGPRGGFAEAYRACRGFPSALRRAHAGDAPGGDPYGLALAALGPDACLVAAALALAPAPLGPEALRRLLPGERAEAACHALAERLLVAFDGAGAGALDAPARDAALNGLGPLGLAADDVRQMAAAALAVRDPPPRAAAGERSAAPSGPPAGDGPLLDAGRHELRAGGRVLRLEGRPVLRGLLYALAARPNAALGKEELVGAVWGVRYHPLRHDNALFVNVRRLRAALAGTGLAVRHGEGGYVLCAPATFVRLDAPP